MKLKLNEKDNKKMIGLFPGMLDEIKDNIRDLSGANANALAPNKNEQKVILANKKYIASMKGILQLQQVQSLPIFLINSM